MSIWGLKRLCGDPKVAPPAVGFENGSRDEKKYGVHPFPYSHPRPKEIKVQSALDPLYRPTGMERSSVS